jgi:hypothetical protein
MAFRPPIVLSGRQPVIRQAGGLSSSSSSFVAGNRIAVFNQSPDTMAYQIYEVATGVENGFTCVRSIERPLGPVVEVDTQRNGWIPFAVAPSGLPGRRIQLYFARHVQELRRPEIEGADPANCGRIRGALRRELVPADLLRAPIPLPGSAAAVQASLQPPQPPELILPPRPPVRLPP